MRPALASARHQARSLQRLLHPGVTQFDPVLGLQLLVKVLHVQIEILLPVQREHFLHRRHRHPAPRRLAAPPVEQPVVAFFHVALPPAPHVPVADAQDLRRLPPGDLLRHCLQHYVLYFHRPLHRGPRISFHAPHGLLSSPPAKRTYHVLSPPDISCATDMRRAGSCKRRMNRAPSEDTMHTDHQGSAIPPLRLLRLGFTAFLLAAALPALAAKSAKPDFGPNVLIFNPSMPAQAIQKQIDAVYATEEHNEFSSQRYALLFLPGSYSVDVPVGFYTDVIGLGASPDATRITGNMHADANHENNNATTTFWRAAEGLSITPAGGAMQWEVSQAVSLRRMHV